MGLPNGVEINPPTGSMPRPFQRTFLVVIVVTYFPEVDRLLNQVGALIPQSQHIVIVDNTPDFWDKSSFSPYRERLSWLDLSKNFGLAFGLNRGIDRAIDLGASHVLLMDQDSLPSHTMVDDLMSGMLSHPMQESIAAVGPNFVDARGVEFKPFWMIGFPRSKVPLSRPDDSLIPTDFLITSGCLIRMEALQKIGKMDESLFIDNVDLEWCLRAKSHGWVLVGVRNAYLSHQLGDAHVPAPWFSRLFGKKFVVRHNATRLYYIMRNRVLLYKMPHVPFAWAAQDVFRIPWKFLISVAIAPDRLKVAVAMLQGILHGAWGVRGKRPEPLNRDD